ncbi:hypothetical protein D3C73_1079390 [compost metagenome]
MVIADAIYVPLFKIFCGLSPLLYLIEIEPIIQAITPMPHNAIGYSASSLPLVILIIRPNVIAEIIAPT